jgi:hypothetical protein
MLLPRKIGKRRCKKEEGNNINACFFQNWKGATVGCPFMCF